MSVPQFGSRFVRLMLYAGLTRGDFHSLKGRLYQRNWRSLVMSCATGFVVVLGVFFSTFGVDSIESKRSLYLATAVAFGVLLATVLVLGKRRAQASIPLYYVFFAIAFVFAGVLGVPFQPNLTSVTFMVLLFALPLLILDRPIRVALAIAVVAVAFSVATMQVKPYEVASIDVVNVASFSVLGIVVNTFMMAAKFNEVMLMRQVESDRDTDSLTQLLTKAATKQGIRDILEQKDAPGALLVMDIDNFKGVNDALGHAFGDAIIRIVGDCIRASFRSGDVMGRFGGDEFVVFMAQVDDRAVIERRLDGLMALVGERLTSTCSEMAVSLGRPVTVSAGVARFPEHARDYDELFDHADKALYAAKAQGKNCYQFYQDVISATDER